MNKVIGARNTRVVVVDNNSDAFVEDDNVAIIGTRGQHEKFNNHFQLYKEFINDNSGPIDLDVKDVDFIVALYYTDYRYSALSRKYFDKDVLIAVSMYQDVATEDETTYYGRIRHYWCAKDWRVVGGLSKMLAYTCYDVIYDDVYNIVGDITDNNGLMVGYKNVGFEKVGDIFVYDKTKASAIIRAKQLEDECKQDSHNKEYM